MRIDQMVDFLEEVREDEGNLEVEEITGFWIETKEVHGTRMVALVVGDGMSVAQAKARSERLSEIEILLK